MQFPFDEFEVLEIITISTKIELLGKEKFFFFQKRKQKVLHKALIIICLHLKKKKKISSGKIEEGGV